MAKTESAITIDVGEANDNHPKDKQTVGKRLAVAARKVAYQDKNSFTSPRYKKMKVKGDKVRVFFKNTGKGLISKDGKKLNVFAIAGKDKKFVRATAVIKGDSVLVWSPLVKQPYAVRYAYESNPENCNFAGQNGFPVSPFRTDRWRVVTQPENVKNL